MLPQHAPHHKRHSKFSYVLAVSAASFIGVAATFLFIAGLKDLSKTTVAQINNSSPLVYAPDHKIKLAIKPSTQLTAVVQAVPVDVATTTRLVFVGDIMLDRGVKKSVLRNGAGDYNFMFYRVPFLAEADIAFANLEGPISDQGADKYNLYSFRMQPEVVDALANAGIDIVSTANNHVGDWGPLAFIDTLSRLKKAGVEYVGGGVNQLDAEGVKIIERNGVKFGFVGFSDVGPNDLGVGPDVAGINLATDEAVVRIVKQAAAEADVVIASFHFGEEYKLLPTDRQKHLARLAVDSGAKIVVGHHPHVIEPVEKYNGGVIVYSLGNFIFDQYFSEETMRGGVLQVDMAGAEVAGITMNTVKLNSAFVPELIK